MNTYNNTTRVQLLDKSENIKQKYIAQPNISKEYEIMTFTTKTAHTQKSVL